jgi:hypothetical protein
MIAPIYRELSSDEQGMGREIQADAADDGAKFVPGHAGNMSITIPKGGSVIITETVGHIDGWSHIEIKQRHEG